MKQFGKILRFELRGYLKNKIFVGITLFLVIAIAALMFVPNIIDAVKSDDRPSDEKLPTMMVKSLDPSLDALAEQCFSEVFVDYRVQLFTGTTDELRDKVTSGEIECAFVLESAMTYTYYVNNLSMYDTNTALADSALQSVYRMSAMIDGGLSPEAAGEILSMQINSRTETLGKDQVNNFFYTYIVIFALYMVILLYGQMVATNVATEKSSRAMEVLITSANPTSMMFGKVLASCIAGFAQLVLVFGSAILFYNLNREQWSDVPIIASIFDMQIYILAKTKITIFVALVIWHTNFIRIVTMDRTFYDLANFIVEIVIARISLN
jgi:ABC-2 type transport system permease protein